MGGSGLNGTGPTSLPAGLQPFFSGSLAIPFKVRFEGVEVVPNSNPNFSLLLRRSFEELELLRATPPISSERRAPCPDAQKSLVPFPPRPLAAVRWLIERAIPGGRGEERGWRRGELGGESALRPPRRRARKKRLIEKKIITARRTTPTEVPITTAAIPPPV
ncbi:hypothetical protein BGZ60DRAFT_405203 [Tricladium varicosporioides]|nr:hypothetical protein BGZ60DRAFT_405203 [Hymenoscyphus varicosporioides]